MPKTLEIIHVLNLTPWAPTNCFKYMGVQGSGAGIVQMLGFPSSFEGAGPAAACCALPWLF